MRTCAFQCLRTGKLQGPDKQASETLREAYKYVSWNVAARPSVTILEQWGETAWFVSYDGPYASNRPRHIRLRKDTCERWPSNVRNGSQFELFELHKKRRAVMWKVRQLFWVDGTPAHFTVHYGPRPLGHFELVPPQAVPKDLAPQTVLANSAADWGLRQWRRPGPHSACSLVTVVFSVWVQNIGCAYG